MNISLLSLKFDEFSEDEISKFIIEEFGVSFVNNEFVGDLDFLKTEIIEHILKIGHQKFQLIPIILHARFKIRDTTEELIRIIETIKTIVKFMNLFLSMKNIWRLAKRVILSRKTLMLKWPMLRKIVLKMRTLEG